MDTNCVNCGAPSELSICSYCKTPQFRKLAPVLAPVQLGPIQYYDINSDAIQTRIDVLYGWASIAPQMPAVRLEAR